MQFGSKLCGSQHLTTRRGAHRRHALRRAYSASCCGSSSIVAAWPSRGVCTRGSPAAPRLQPWMSPRTHRLRTECSHSQGLVTARGPIMSECRGSALKTVPIGFDPYLMAALYGHLLLRPTPPMRVYEPCGDPHTPETSHGAPVFRFFLLGIHEWAWRVLLASLPSHVV